MLRLISGASLCACFPFCFPVDNSQGKFLYKPFKFKTVSNEVIFKYLRGKDCKIVWEGWLFSTSNSDWLLPTWLLLRSLQFLRISLKRQEGSLAYEFRSPNWLHMVNYLVGRRPLKFYADNTHTQSSYKPGFHSSLWALVLSLHCS